MKETIDPRAVKLIRRLDPATVKAWAGLTPDEIEADVLTARLRPNRRDRRQNR